MAIDNRIWHKYREIENIWPTYRSMVPLGTDPDPDDELANDIRTAIILNYLYLAEIVVKSRKKTLPKHVESDDLESWAKIGLLQAVQRYDHTRGVPFEAFVTQRMRSVIGDGIRDSDWAPRSLRKAQRAILKAEDDIRKEGREPTESEIATALETTVDEISTTKYKSEIASHTYIEGNLEAQNMSSGHNDEEDEMIFLLKNVLASTVANMPVKKAVVIAMHYYEERKLADIAKILKTSEVKVGALHTEAVLEIWTNLLKAISDG